MAHERAQCGTIAASETQSQYSMSRCMAPSHRLQLIKFDPRVNARVLFKEEKIKK